MGKFENIELGNKSSANSGQSLSIAEFSPVNLLVILISLILVLGLILIS